MTLQLRYALSPALARILELLALNQAVTAQMICEGQENVRTAKIAVHRLRSRLEKYNITVQSRRGLGYWLSHEDRERVLEDMKPDQLELPLVGGGDSRKAS